MPLTKDDEKWIYQTPDEIVNSFAPVNLWGKVSGIDVCPIRNLLYFKNVEMYFKLNRNQVQLPI